MGDKIKDLKNLSKYLDFQKKEKEKEKDGSRIITSELTDNPKRTR